MNLAFLDTSDTILEVVTYDSTTIHNTMVMADAFRMIGYPPTKVRYLVNRADSTGGIDPAVLEPGARPRARAPRVLRRRARRPGEQPGHPVRARRPERADQPGRRADGGRAGRGTGTPGRGGAPVAGGRVSDPRPIGVFDSGVGGLTVLREILRRTPHESTIYLGDNARAPYGVRPDEEVRVLDRGARRAGVARRQGARRRLQHVHGRRAARPARAATTCPSWASSGPARPPPRSRPATGGSA